MDERTRRSMVLFLTRHLRILADMDLDRQEIDFASERLVHDFFRVIHNAIVYVRGIRGVTESLDNWERRHGRGPTTVAQTIPLKWDTKADISAPNQADVSVTELMAQWANAEMTNEQWQDALRIAITHLNVEEQNRLDENVTILYFLI